jgi:hypothetical protein
MSRCPRCEATDVQCADHAVTILEELAVRLKGRSVTSAQLASAPSSAAIESAWILR